MKRFDLTQMVLALLMVAICAPGAIWWCLKLWEAIR